MNEMKRFFGLLAALVALIGIAGIWGHLSHAQQVPGNVASPVQQTATHADAATTAATSASTGGTLTFAAQSGLYFYLTGLDVADCAGASAVTAAAVTSITTTNLTGSPAWTVGSGTTAGACQSTLTMQWPTGLKSSAPGTATVITLPPFATNQTVRVNAYGFYAQ